MADLGDVFGSLLGGPSIEDSVAKAAASRDLEKGRVAAAGLPVRGKTIDGIRYVRVDDAIKVLVTERLPGSVLLRRLRKYRDAT